MDTKKKKVEVIRTVWRHWKPSFKKSMWVGIGAFIFYSFSFYLEFMFRPVAWKDAFDALASHGSPWYAFERAFWASLFMWGASRIGDYCLLNTESNLIKQLKDYALRHILTKNTEFFVENPSGGLVAKWRRFAQSSEPVVDIVIFSLIRAALLAIYVTIYAWILIPELAIPLALWIVSFVSITTVLARVKMKYDLESSAMDSVTTGHVSDILLSVSTLRVFSAVPWVIEKFKQVTLEDYIKRRVAWYLGNLQWAVQGALFVSVELYCMHEILASVELGTHTIGTAVLVQSYILSLSMYMWDLGKNLIRMRTLLGDAYEMAEILDQESTEPISAPEKEDHIVLPHNGIAISEVTHRYTNGVVALKNFSFSFKPGKHYGLIGKTGSGKTTLIKLLLRVYDLQSGSIRIGDICINTTNHLILRSLISYVPQEPQFPSWTIRDIIALGKPGATDEEVRAASEKASCDFIWTKLPHGFQTVVGERGVKLSGGERQRLAIAAAILKDAPVVIMDEPTSALDARTEKSIQDAIKSHFNGKLMIVIAHRLATVAALDEIILLENGIIKHSDYHDRLLQVSKDYREMWELQTKPTIV